MVIHRSGNILPRAFLDIQYLRWLGSVFLLDLMDHMDQISKKRKSKANSDPWRIETTDQLQITMDHCGNHWLNAVHQDAPRHESLSIWRTNVNSGPTTNPGIYGFAPWGIITGMPSQKYLVTLSEVENTFMLSQVSNGDVAGYLHRAIMDRVRSDHAVNSGNTDVNYASLFDSMKNHSDT